MHTPGPWKIEDGEPNSKIVYIVEYDGESTIGEIDLSGDGIDEEIGRANARLIAASPAMLDTLDRIANGEFATNVSPAEQVAAMRTIARAAIAQATT